MVLVREVDMGSPILTPAQIPVIAEAEAVAVPILVDETEYQMTGVSMEILMQSYLWMISNIWRLRRSDRNSSIMNDFRTE